METKLFRATFTGKNGSLGYINNKPYVIKISSDAKSPAINIIREDGTGACLYSNFALFSANWNDIKQITGSRERKVQEPLIEGSKDDTLGQRQSHPAYGLLQISRVSGGNLPMFGSSINHDHFISLRICRGEKRRELGMEWYSDKGEIIEVYMSSTQFAEAITSLNHGNGVPCTIQHKEHDFMPLLPQDQRKSQHATEFKERMQKFAERLGKIKQEANEFLPKMTKKDAAEWSNKINLIISEVSSGIPYFEQQFREQMEKTVVEAKGEVEAFVNHAIITTGLEAIKGKKDQSILQEKTEDLNHETL
jgi:hypothetical protein